MKIAVTKTMSGAPDGVHTQKYVAGETYEMPDDLGSVFVRERWGMEVKEPVKEPVKAPAGGDDTKGGKGPDKNK